MSTEPIEPTTSYDGPPLSWRERRDLVQIARGTRGVTGDVEERSLCRRGLITDACWPEWPVLTPLGLRAIGDEL